MLFDLRPNPKKNNKKKITEKKTDPWGPNGIIGSIPCGCIECITAPVPPALIVPFNSDQEIYLFVTSHAV